MCDTAHIRGPKPRLRKPLRHVTLRHRLYLYDALPRGNGSHPSMAIKIVPHSPELKPAVLEFNARMHRAGSPWGFYADPEPQWIPREPGAPVWREYHLAVEDDQFVRGAYALKPQLWLVNGRIECVSDWQGPFSEGAIDQRYSSLGLRFLRDMLKKYPLLYSVGHGGFEEPMVHLLRSLGWTMHGMPFCLHVVRPFRFLRGNRYLRRSPARRLLLDALAWTGFGPIGIRGLHTFHRISNSKTRGRADAHVVPSFGPWADQLWEANASQYRCTAVRDAAMMNRLVPAEGFPGGTRLRVDRGGVAIGWALVHHRRMTNDHRFGRLYVGSITDCFGSPADAEDVIGAAHQYLVSQGVDLIYANQSHPGWVQGFRGNGYVILENRRLFAVSPKLKESMEPFCDTTASLHLTNLDGHGPSGFDGP